MLDTSLAEIEVVDDSAQFFAPTNTDLIDSLLGEYGLARKRIDTVAALADGDLGNVMHYFLEGNTEDDRTRSSLYVDKLFKADGAVAALNAAYWSKALSLTDVLDCMPQKRRNEWFLQLRSPMGKKKPRASYYARDTHDEWEIEPLPEFTEDTVRSTISGLLAMRHTFFAERVDGIFRALSSDHVTNVPEGFGRRMIIGYVVNDWGHPASSRVGYINDLRAVIAKFMGRDEPHWNATDAIVRNARVQHGEWLKVDGGALRIRVYLKGTAHLEVHPDIAYRLNQVLAHLHPMAIPAQFRTKPAKKTKEFEMMGRPLPFAVLAILQSFTRAKNSDTWAFSHSNNKAAMKQACAVVEAIGGVPDKGDYRFDYDPSQALAHIVASGCIPDQQSHQFYPTPEALARRVVDMAMEGDTPDMQWLEPSAGLGGLADLMPRGRTGCIEISALHCQILEAKGHMVQRADFMAVPQEPLFDRIVMNPPFSEGRAKAHTAHAFGMLKPGGVLVAVLPSGMRNSEFLAGADMEWSPVLENQFDGTTVDVVLMRATPLELT